MYHYLPSNRLSCLRALDDWVILGWSVCSTGRDRIAARYDETTIGEFAQKHTAHYIGVKGMAKKSTAARKTQAARRAQTAQRTQNVALVRAPDEGTSATTLDTAATTTEKPATPTATRPSLPTTTASAAQSPRSSATAGRATATASRPATSSRPASKPAPTPQRNAPRDQERRIARAKEMRRIRAENVVTPEHYRYVIQDLRMTGVLAALMFAVIIVLHFVLG